MFLLLSPHQFMYDDDDDTDSQLSIRPDQMAFRRHRPRGRTQYCAQQYTDRNTHSSTVRDRPGIKSKLAAATGPCATDRPGSGSNAAGMCRRVGSLAPLLVPLIGVYAHMSPFIAAAGRQGRPGPAAAVRRAVLLCGRLAFTATG